MNRGPHVGLGDCIWRFVEEHFVLVVVGGIVVLFSMIAFVGGKPTAARKMTTEIPEIPSSREDVRIVFVPGNCEAGDGAD